MRRSRLLWAALGLATVGVAGCADDLDTSRVIPPRGTLGEEMYGVLCDRVAAQALHEDLTGASFRSVCHKGPDGTFGDKVDESVLPGAVDGVVDKDGKPISIDDQKKSRAYAIARIGALVRRRGDLIRALDATFPDIKVPVKDVANGDAKASCNDKGQRRFHDELSDMLGRFQNLYDDGTIPQSTEALATLMKGFKLDQDAQSALARFDSRQGYRPIEVALGAMRPVIAYPGLRDLSNATLRLLSADSDPYAPDPKLDANGNRIPVPGAANAQFTKLLDVVHEEFLNAKADTVLPPLSQTADPNADRVILSRPRDDLEIIQTLFYAQDASFGTGDPRYIVKRDGRGYAQVALQNGAVPAPFVDANHDGLADVDDLGRFVTSNGGPAAPPFLTVDADPSVSRDSFGRVTLYDYIDTSHTFAAHLLGDMKPLVNPNPDNKHETMMYAVAGAPVIFGARDGSPKTTKKYTDDGVALSYDAFHPESAAMLDLIYAFGQILGDHNTDDVLLYTKQLFNTQTAAVARLAGDGLAVKDIGNKHAEAKIPPSSTLWDEMLDTLVKVAAEPGLLEDVMRSLGDDATLGLGPAFGNYMKFKDRITYDPNNLNGPPLNLETNDNSPLQTAVDRSKPDTGFNRSAMQRFSSLVHDTIGVTACNKDKALVHAKGIPIAGSITLPLTGTYQECEVFKIENLAKFYLDAIVGKAELYFRPSILRNGVLGIGAASVDTIEQSSGIGLNANDTYGFWDDTNQKSFHPRPQWLNRLVFFDLDNDQSAPTHDFLLDLQGKNIGSSVCPERVIDDPDPSAADASSDGKVHGLRDCQEGDWLAQRGQYAIFAWENFDFYKSLAPLLNAFVNHKREDLFIELLDTLHRHWADDKQSADECKLSPTANCSKDGTVTYEDTLAEAFATDLLPALHDTIGILDTTTIKHCTAADPKSHGCTQTQDVDGIQVLAAATRALIDPAYAKAQGMKDRFGKTTALRNDGTTNPQVTAAYLLTNALNAMDKSFTDYAATHPDDTDRQTQWRAARSQLVDQFLAAQGSGANASFVNGSIPKIVPILIDVVRSQMLANCPTSYAPPYDRCAWAKDDLTKKASDVIGGPVFAAAMDLSDALRKNDDARTQLEALLTYLLDAASDNEALPSMLASTSDIIQLLRDDTNLVPLYHVLAGAMARGGAAAGDVGGACKALAGTSPGTTGLFEDPACTSGICLGDNRQNADLHLYCSADCSTTLCPIGFSCETVDYPSFGPHGGVTRACMHVPGFQQKSLVDASTALLAKISGRAFDKAGDELCNKELDPNQILTVALSNLVTPMQNADGSPGQTPLQVIMDVVGDVNRMAPDRTDKLDPLDYANISDNVIDFLTNKERGLEQFYEIVRQGTVR